MCFNILATRVHLGVADSYKFSSLLVSEGYANLTSFTSVRNKDKTKSYQFHLCFLPDPVCEALAMGLMKPKWRIEKDKFSLIAGLPRWFWSRKVLLLLQSGVCFPDKGDIGVVLGALYCLFCGDVLRYELDNTRCLPLVIGSQHVFSSFCGHAILCSQKTVCTSNYRFHADTRLRHYLGYLTTDHYLARKPPRTNHQGESHPIQYNLYQPHLIPTRTGRTRRNLDLCIFFSSPEQSIAWHQIEII